MQQAAAPSVTNNRTIFRILSVLLIILGLMMLSLLVRERMPVAEQKQWCVLNVQIAKYVRLLMVCDTTEFLTLAHEPARMMQPGVDRQTRPLLIIGAWSLGWIYQPLTPIFSRLVPTAPQSTTYRTDVVEFAINNMIPEYLGYLTINVLIVMAAVFIVVRAVPLSWIRLPGDRNLLIAVATLFFSNNVVKAFIWTPQTQMLNILVPVWGMSVLLRPMTTREQRRTALVAGVGMLAYFNFALLFGALVVAPLVRGFAAGQWPRSARAFIQDTLWLLVLFAIPSLVWMLTLKLITGGLHVSEVDRYGHIVWLFDAARQGVPFLIGSIAAKMVFFLGHAVVMALPACAVIVYVIYRLRRFAAEQVRPGIVSLWGHAMREPIIAALTVSALSWGFLVIVGWEAARLSFLIACPMIFLACFAVTIAAVQNTGIWRRADQWLFVGFAVLVMAHVLIKDGPWS